MGFVFKKYQDIKNTFLDENTKGEQKGLNVLKGRHKVLAVDELPAHRRIPAQFIKAIMNRLDKEVSEKQKATIITGYLYIRARMIESEHLTAPRSVLYQSLLVSAGINAENPLDTETKYTTIKAAREDFVNFIYKADGKTINLDCPLFSILGFNHTECANFLTFITNEEKSAHNELLNERLNNATKLLNSSHVKSEIKSIQDELKKEEKEEKKTSQKSANPKRGFSLFPDNDDAEEHSEEEGSSYSY